MASTLTVGGLVTSTALTVNAGAGADAVSILRMGTANSGANKSSINFQNSVGSEIFAIDYTNTGTTLDINSDIGGSIFTLTRAGGIVINQDGGDHDVRIESDGNTNMLFVDGGNDHVNIGTSSDYGGMFNVSGKMVVKALDGELANDYIASFQNQEATDSQSFGVSIAAGSTGSDIALNVVDHDAGNVLLRVFGNGATTIGGAATFSGVASFTDGSSSAPSITNTGDSNTGIYFPADEKIGFTAGGVPTFALDNQGNLLYTSSFQIQSDAQDGQIAIAGGNNSNDGANLGFYGPSHASLANIGKFRADTVETFRFGPTGLVFNEGSVADQDFRIESNSKTHMFFVDSGADVIGIKNDSPASAATHLSIGGDTISTAKATVSIVDTNPSIHMRGGSPKIYFDVTGGGVPELLSDGTAIYIKDGGIDTPGNITHVFGSSNSGTTVINESSQNIDFRVESDGNTHALFVDAGNNRVGILNDAPAFALDVGPVGSSGGDGIQINAVRNATLRFLGTDTSIQADEVTGRLEFYTSDSNNAGVHGQILTLSTNTIGSGEMQIWSGTAGSIAKNVIFRGDQTVFNQDGNDMDFRVESNASSQALNVDGATGNVGFGTNATSNYSQTSGTGTLAYKVDNGSEGSSLMVSNNADRGWANVYLNKFAWAAGDDTRVMQFYINASDDTATLEYDGTNFAIVNPSDYRLKENVVSYTGGLAKINAIGVKSFNKIDGISSHITQEGFIAHELKAVIPLAVMGEKDSMKTNESGEVVPDYQRVNRETLIPYLVSAIQELSAKVETLESRIAALES